MVDVMGGVRRVLAPRGRRRGRGGSPVGSDDLARGALAGVIATGFMTPVIAAGRALRLLGTPPPEQITANAAERVGVEPERDEPAFQLGWLAAHAGYGAACGAIYVAVRPVLPTSTPVAGLLFGGAAWLTSYYGVLPALRLYPWPKDDSNTRLAVMVVAHAVFGLSLADAERRLAAA